MEPPINLYAASCNPSRKAKVPRPNESPPQSSSAPTAVGIPAAPTIEDASTLRPQPQPAKRGRKPGTMSKAARETQRKLNHSIIEKARRTKINDALATLRQLVPPDFGNEKKQADEGGEGEVDYDDDDDDDDGDFQEKKKSKPKKPGKKEEKEREFKLEILIRTVAYMQLLIRRVADLEEQVGVRSETNKRKRDTVTCNTTELDREVSKRRKLDNSIDQPTEHHSRPRLPSISTWLPGINPALKSSPTLPISSSPSLTLTFTSPAHLPSPPSSTQFKPFSPPSKGLPQLPSLNLGPTAVLTRSRSNTLATTTPEEESAASVLLNFRSGASCSPGFLPTPGSSVVVGNDNGTSPSPKLTIEALTGEFEPMEFTLSQTKEWSPLTGFTSSLSSTSSCSETPPLGVRNLIAQTPSSILGLRRV